MILFLNPEVTADTMTRFLDGPAKGQTLMLKRAPVYLRVVRDAGGKWDALDQLTDAPALDEEIFVYVLDSHPGAAFIDGPKVRGRYPIAAYRFIAPQPERHEVRDNGRWQAWCEKQGMPQHLKPNDADSQT